MVYLFIVLTSFLTALLFYLLQFLRFDVKKPIVLMKENEINENALKKAKISISEFMSRAREAGIFNIGDIDTAILEPSGKISFLPTPMKRQLNPKDFNFAPVREGVSKTIIENGRILSKNLKSSGISSAELSRLLSERGNTLQDILFATVNEAGRVDFFEKQQLT